MTSGRRCSTAYKDLDSACSTINLFSRGMWAVDIAVLSTGRSAPPSVTRMGLLSQWVFVVAMDLAAVTPSGSRP
jgi:hypothetical protein